MSEQNNNTGMIEEAKKRAELASFNQTVKSQLEQTEDIFYKSTSVIVTKYPNELDIKGELYVANVHIKEEQRVFFEPDIFVKFFLLNRNSTAPRIFQRWAMISALAAVIGRNCYTEEEGRRTYPNMYVALVGESGAGKTTAIDMVKPLMRRAGYKSIADAATTKDKFLMDMHSSFDYLADKKKTLADQLDEELDYIDEDSACEGWICCSEWNEYFRTQGTQGNFDFINTILNMYDCPESMSTRSKVGGNIYIRNPTLNVIGGATIPSLLQFAPILAAEPFYSRTCVIYAPPTNQVESPSKKAENLENAVISMFSKIREMKGEVKFCAEDGARDLFDSILATASEYRVPDSRLSPFYSRRGLHLRKLCIILAVASRKMTITTQIIMHANTIITFAESFMQRGLGEYGGGRMGVAESVIMQELNSAPGPMKVGELIQRTSHVVENVTKLGDIVGKLAAIKRVGLNEANQYYSIQKNFRVDSPFAPITELYEYY